MAKTGSKFLSRTSTAGVNWSNNKAVSRKSLRCTRKIMTIRTTCPWQKQRLWEGSNEGQLAPCFRFQKMPQLNAVGIHQTAAPATCWWCHHLSPTRATDWNWHLWRSRTWSNINRCTVWNIRLSHEIISPFWWICSVHLNANSHDRIHTINTLYCKRVYTGHCSYTSVY